MTIDINKIKAAAMAATDIHIELYEDRYFSDPYSKADLTVEQDRFVEEAYPAAILELIERLEAAEQDAARLNFLDENLAKNMGWYCGVAPFGNVSMQSVLCSKKTIREAIDAARKETK